MGDYNEVAELRQQFIAIAGDVATLKAGQASIESALESKHKQNRGDIHILRNTFQDFVDKFGEKMDKMAERITDLRIQNARWSVGAGILTAISVKAIEHWIK